MNKATDSYLLHMVEQNETLDHPLIRCVGHEFFTNDGNEHCVAADRNLCAFVYTVSGCCVIDGKEGPIRMVPGSVFLNSQSGGFHFSLPEHESCWESRYVFFNSSTRGFFETITKKYSDHFKITADSRCILYHELILRKVSERKVETIFDNSQLAYSFLMTFENDLYKKRIICSKNETVDFCVNYIKSNYDRNITLSDIAVAGNISPFYLDKCFHEVLGDSPINILTKERIKQSAKMLVETELSVGKIAKLSGFSNGNYFAKVFYKTFNESPSKFRSKKQKPVII